MQNANIKKENRQNDALSIGKLGEDLACEYLIKSGYKLLERNYRRKFGEIDIIAKSKESTLIFFEVKTLKSNGPNLFMPEDNATFWKIQKMRRIAQFFASQNPILISADNGWRIDLISISLDEKMRIKKLQHYENI